MIIEGLNGIKTIESLSLYCIYFLFYQNNPLMKSTIFFFLSICYFYHISAQDTTYNKVFELPYYGSEVKHATVHDDTIIMYGTGFFDTINFQQGVFFSKYDTNGHLIDSTMILYPAGNSLYAQSKIRIGSNNNSYVVTVGVFSRRNAMLLKLNRNLDVEISKEYIDTTTLSNYSYAPVVIENGYFLRGEKEKQDSYNDAFVSLTDEEGEILWTKYINPLPFDNYIGNLVPMNDSLFVFNMLHHLETQFIGQHTTSKTSIRIMNKNGELVNSYLSEPDPAIGIASQIFVEDGYFLTYGLHISDIVGASQTRLYQPTFAKIPFDLSDVSWTKPFGAMWTVTSHNMLRNFTKSYDGYHLGAGGSLRNPEDQVNGRAHGWLYKFDSNGDKIWEKDIPPPAEFDDISYNTGFFHSIGILSDGQIIAVGEIYDSEAGKDRPWIVRLDRDGCLETPCETTVATTNVTTNNNFSLEVSPNPFYQELRISYHLPQREKINLYLTDILGRKITFAEKIGEAAGEHHISWSARHLAKGIYFVVLESAQERYVRKVVKN